LKLRYLFAGLMAASVSILGGPMVAGAAPAPDVVVFKGNAAINAGGTCSGAVCWKGGVGNYTFTDSSCNAVSGDDLGLPGCTIGLSGGSFTNTACGTGTADSTGPTSLGENDEASETINSYHIDFVAGLGVMQGSSTDGNLTAVVQISPSNLTAPSPGAPGNGPCTPGFSVAGVGVTLS
jgi:hypothetical protein